MIYTKSSSIVECTSIFIANNHAHPWPLALRDGCRSDQSFCFRTHLADYLLGYQYDGVLGSARPNRASLVAHQEIGKILNIAHTWGAVRLLDEADVFLEARMAQDIHRKGLVQALGLS